LELLTDNDDYGDVPKTYQEAIDKGYKAIHEAPLIASTPIKTWNNGAETPCKLYACVNHRQTILYRDDDGNCTKAVYRDC
jgi:hypothetical protein